MDDPTDVIGVLSEVFTWAGGAGAVIVGVILLIIMASDGTWLPADAIADREDDRTIVRWFSPDGVGAAELSHVDAEELGERHLTPIFYRLGRLDRARLHRRNPALKPLGRIAIGLASLCLVATAVGLLMIAL